MKDIEQPVSKQTIEYAVSSNFNVLQDQVGRVDTVLKKVVT